jgi:hypothetical protein
MYSNFSKYGISLVHTDVSSGLDLYNLIMLPNPEELFEDAKLSGDGADYIARGDDAKLVHLPGGH